MDNSRPRSYDLEPATQPDVFLSQAVLHMTEFTEDLATHTGLSQSHIESVLQCYMPTHSLSDSQIIGMEDCRRLVMQLMVAPLKFSDLYNANLLKSPKRLLLFGPSGTGKTMLAKWMCREVKATFFSISPSTLVTKYIGESEKLVRTVFHLARLFSPAVVFVDEVDALLSKRSGGDGEGAEASTRLKNQFLTELDGLDSESSRKFVFVGATNLPWNLDQAMLRRFPKRVYIALPTYSERVEFVAKTMAEYAEQSKTCPVITKEELLEAARRSEGYSCADLKMVCEEAVKIPIEECTKKTIDRMLHSMESQRDTSGALFRISEYNKYICNDPLDVITNDDNEFSSPEISPSFAEPRNVNGQDILLALAKVPATNGSTNLEQFAKWSQEFGTKLT